MDLFLATSWAVSVFITYCCSVCLSNACLLPVKTLFLCNFPSSGIATWSSSVSFYFNIWNTILLPMPQSTILWSGLDTVIFLCQFTDLYLLLLTSLPCFTGQCKTSWAAFGMACAGHYGDIQDVTVLSWSQPACWCWSTASPQVGSWVERRHVEHCGSSVPVFFTKVGDDKSHIAGGHLKCSDLPFPII